MIPRNVTTDPEGLIVPKKLINPCLESQERRQLHQELMFNKKVGKTVLNQKSELHRAFEKQREKMINNAKQEETKCSLSNELQKAISERNARHEENNKSTNSSSEFNEEYLNIRAKLKHSDSKLA